MPQSMSVKPGCYGSPLCYDLNTFVCGQCVYRVQCATAAEDRSKRLKERFDIEPLLATSRKTFNRAKTNGQTPARKRAKSEPKQDPIEKFAHTLLDRLQSVGVDLRQMPLEQVEQGAMPPFLHTAWNLFVKGGCNATELMKVYQEKWGWSGQNATTHAMLAIKALQISGVARFEPGRSALMPVQNMIAEVIE